MEEDSNDTPVVALLLTVFDSIFEVFLLCLAGYILAGQGILDKKTQKQINRLNVSLFTPALLFSKVAFFLSPAKLRELWIVPIFFVLVTAVSMAVSFTLGWMFKLKKSQRSFAMAAAMFMNSNSLPIALMQSLVVQVPGLKWGDDDNENAMVGRALTYLVVYSTLGMVLRWSYGVRLLSQADDPVPEPEILISEETPLLAARDHHVSTSTFISEPEEHVPQPITHLRPTPRRRTTYYRSFPNSPEASQTHLPRIDADSTPASTLASDEETDDDGIRPPSPLPLHGEHTPKPPPTTFRRGKRRVRRAWAAFNDFMTVPLWAALASILVACIRPIQHVLETHVLSIKGALTSAGNCSIPLTLVVLGAYFYPSPPADQSTTANANAKAARARKSTDTLVHSVKDFLTFRNRRAFESGNGHGNQIGNGHGNGHVARTEKNPGETRTVVIAVLSRMVITPLLLMPVVALSAKYDWQRVFEDPVFVVANVLLVSSPPALTLAQITQAASGDAFERLISRTIFWSYCVLTPPATIFYVVVGLVISRL
ncbi:membrane transport protein-domain-containing protein [Lyophyllum atratum]|nr:membrane transport protein-domain-containing protein [Lyophyllum atratum]